MRSITKTLREPATLTMSKGRFFLFAGFVTFLVLLVAESALQLVRLGASYELFSVVVDSFYWALGSLLACYFLDQFWSYKKDSEAE